VTTARRAFEEALEDVLTGGRPATRHVLDGLHTLWETWAHRGARSDPAAGYFAGAATPWKEILAKIERRVGFAFESVANSGKPVKPRHRLADEFPLATFERLDELLAARNEALETGGSLEDLSQVDIARELSELPPGLDFDRSRVQRAERVLAMCREANIGDLCALLRSQPEFCAANGMWRLPTPEKVRVLLGL
jgi:hypothetical protein